MTTTSDPTADELREAREWLTVRVCVDHRPDCRGGSIDAKSGQCGACVCRVQPPGDAVASLARLLASRRAADAAARTTGMRDMATAIVASLTGLLPLLREGAVRAQWRDDPHACLALVIETIKARHVDGVRDLVAALAPPAPKETP